MERQAGRNKRHIFILRTHILYYHKGNSSDQLVAKKSFQNRVSLTIPKILYGSPTYLLSLEHHLK